MEKKIIVCCILFISQISFAQSSVQRYFENIIQGAQWSSIQSGGLHSQQSSGCTAKLAAMENDGKIDILVAFGYMDGTLARGDSNPENFKYDPGSTTDIQAKRAFEVKLKERCLSDGRVSNQACGFQGRNGKLSKRINGIKVNIELVNSSISSSNSQNSSSNKQLRHSANVSDKFKRALGNKDAVIYMGHARSGGGPDFYPPKLTSGGYVNYGYYKSNLPGLRNMLSGLSGKSDPAVLGLVACNSKNLFARAVDRVAPFTSLVTTTDLFAFNDIVSTGYLIVEAVVSRRCGNDFFKVVKSTSSASTTDIAF